MAMTNFERRWSKAYTVEFLAATALYMVLLYGTRKFLPHANGDIEKGLLSLVPMIGIGAMTFAIARGLLRADELQRRRLLEIMTISSALTIFLTLAYGFLEFSIGLPRLSMFAVWPVMAMSWIVVGIVYLVLGRISWIWPWSRS